MVPHIYECRIYDAKSFCEFIVSKAPIKSCVKIHISFNENLCAYYHKENHIHITLKLFVLSTRSFELICRGFSLSNNYKVGLHFA